MSRGQLARTPDNDDPPFDEENEGDWICEHTRPDLFVGIDPGAPDSAIVFDRATGRIIEQ